MPSSLNASLHGRTRASNTLSRSPTGAERARRRRGPYRARLSDRQRVDVILQYIRDTHKWSLTQFITVLFTAEKESGAHGDTLSYRQRKCIEALYGNEDIAESIRRFVPESIINTKTSIYSQENILDEIEALRSASTGTGQFSNNTGPLTPDTVKNLDKFVASAYGQIQMAAPSLHKLLLYLLSSRRDKSSALLEPSGTLIQRITSIIAIISFTRHRNTANHLQKHIGLYLHASGVKRRVIEVLHSLGLTEAPTTINRFIQGIASATKETIRSLNTASDIGIIYDNFDYQEEVRHNTIGSKPVQRSVTTGKIVRCRGLPDGGLLQSMFDPTVELKKEDIWRGAGLRLDTIQKAIDTFQIWRAMKTTFPALATKFHGSSREPAMPEVDRVTSSKTASVTLGPILFNEGTIDGNYGVTDNIFLQQLGVERESELGKDLFSRRLILAYGDQKTSQLLRSLQQQQSEALSDYDRRQWLLGLPSLWHLRQAFLWLIQRSYSGGPDQDAACSLQHNIMFWDRRKIPLRDGPFYRVEELVTDSFHARNVALMYRHLVDTGQLSPTSDSQSELESYLQCLPMDRILAVVEGIRSQAFLQHHWKGPVQDSEELADEEFLTHTRFLRMVGYYLMLKWGVKHGDIGLICRAINVCCVYFQASGQNNYAFEMLWLKRLTMTSTCTPDLQRAILSNLLVNPRGQPDTFQESDLFLEHLNLDLKRQLWARRNGTFGIGKLFRITALTCEYNAALIKAIESCLGTRTSSEHVAKSKAEDIYCLAIELAQNSMRRQPGRECNLKSKDLLRDGLHQLLEWGGSLESFNKRVVKDNFKSYRAVIDETSLIPTQGSDEQELAIGDIGVGAQEESCLEE